MLSSQISQEVYDITLTSTIPYLQNRFRIEEHDDTKKLTAGKKVYDPTVEAKKAMYVDPYEGNVFMPSEHILMATVNAGAAFKMKGNKTYKSVLPSIIDVQPERPGVGQRARVVRYRPKFISWTAKFQVHLLDATTLTAYEMKEFIEYAGRMIGIGDYRPRFGRFYVSSFKVGGQEELVEQELVTKTA